MGRGPTAARLTVAALAAVVAAIVEVLPQRASGALDPAPVDVLVGAGFAAVAVLLLRVDRPLPGLALAAAAAVWTAVGAAPLIGGPGGDLALRLALLPHALALVVLVSLPSGRLDARAKRALALLAVAVAVGAGTGRLPFPLAAVGAVALIGALPPWDRGPSAARAALGGVFVVVDLLGLAGVLPAAAAMDAVDVTLLAATGALPRLLDRESRLWAAASGPSEAIGAGLGRALQTGALRIAVPCEGGYVDPDGRDLPEPVGATEIRDGHQVLVLLSPPVRIDPLLGPSVVRVLDRVAGIARGRAEERRLVAELDRSRSLLLRAGDEERRDLVARVSALVGGRVREVRTRLVVLGGVPNLVARADAVQVELAGIGEPPDLGEPGALSAALDRLGRPPVEVSVVLPTAVPPTVARVLWYACAEAIANAAKHAPLARVRVTVTRTSEAWLASVQDDGPGGADADGPGLQGLRDRTADVDGTVTVDSGAEGTRLTVRIPVEAVEVGRETGRPAVPDPVGI